MSLFGLDETIRRFEKRLEIMQSCLDALLDKLDKMEDRQELSDQKFAACAVGFRQVKEACECLREELSEASGTLVESAYND